MEIVNTKLEEDGNDILLNGIGFYARIEAALATNTRLTSPNTREALRAAWLTCDNQLMNYEQWEFWCVDLGFARYATEDEKATQGNLVFYQDQERRIVQFDEMGFSLDGKKNGKGGRPAAVPKNPALPDPQQPTSHSNQKVTCLCGMNYACEAIPPLFVVASGAENPKLQQRFLLNMHQVKGRFGYPPVEEGKDSRAFSTHVAFSKEGSVDTEILTYFIEYHIHQLYPDVEDTPGKRVLLKAYLGPGRWNTAFRTIARRLGIYFFPGLPNGTELGQEMDQLFGVLKSIMEENRDRLWKARYHYERAKAKTSTWDLPWILFGGDVLLMNSKSIHLRNAFEEGLNPSKIKGAMEKCGYIPATRVLLNSEKLIHKLSDDDDIDSKNNGKADVHKRLIASLERRNHLVVDELINKGYRLADRLKQNIQRISKKKMSSSNSITVPYSFKRQKLLMNTRQGGEWFKATNGGAPLNCDDAIIAMEREQILDQKNCVKKRNKAFEVRQKEIKTAQRVRGTKGRRYNPKGKKNRSGTFKANWTVADLKAMIKWKVPKQKNVPTDREGLAELWNEVKGITPPSLNLRNQQNCVDTLAQFEGDGPYQIERTFILCGKLSREERRLLAFS